jgi:hypothetical protein
MTLWEIHIKIFSSETTGPIATKLWWNDPWMAPFQILGRRAEPPDIFLEENHPMTISSTFSSY